MSRTALIRQQERSGQPVERAVRTQGNAEQTHRLLSTLHHPAGFKSGVLPIIIHHVKHNFCLFQHHALQRSASLAFLRCAALMPHHARAGIVSRVILCVATILAVASIFVGVCGPWSNNLFQCLQSCAVASSCCQGAKDKVPSASFFLGSEALDTHDR